VRATALVVAAGSSSRMGADKLWVELGGEPVLLRTLRVLSEAELVSDLVIVVREDSARRTRELAGCLTKPWQVCAGGPRRQDSVNAGLAFVDADIVVVHDGARPLVDPAIVDAGVRLAAEHGAAIAALPCVETIKRVGDDHVVLDTPERAELWSVQTPQVFRTKLLRTAHTAVTGDVTDDAAMVERLGHAVRVYPGSRRNIKITNAEDLAIAEALLRG
jgi:2-C-methyl-D-erythritol 4-phosphate cytidylyltransferase